MTPLSAWQNFYVIMGSSAGALIGLQFVVLSLIATMPTRSASPAAAAAFATPTIIHFSTVLLLSGILTMPWNGVGSAAVVLGLVGVSGVVYVIVTVLRMRRQNAYRPEFEDWLFHVLIPLTAYLLLVATASVGAVGMYVREALFGVALSELLLLFTGIHNAWDAVTYHIFVVAKRDS